MLNLVIGQEVPVGVKSLYMFNIYRYPDGGPAYGHIEINFNGLGDEPYYDLYNPDGYIACMDGEVCEVTGIEDDKVFFVNKAGDYPVEFVLTQEEAGVACYSTLKKEI